MPYEDLTEGQKYYPGSTPFLEGALIRHGINGQGGIIPFGYGLVRGDGDELVEIPKETGQTFIGVATKTDSIERREGYSLDSDGRMGWPEAHSLSHYRRGVVAVYIDTACTKDAPAFLIHTADGPSQVPGHFAATALGGDADAVAAVFATTLTAPGIGLIEINLPQS